MNRLLLLRPISRAIRVQRPISCLHNLNRAFSTTKCRKLGATSVPHKQPTRKLPTAEVIGMSEEAESRMLTEQLSDFENWYNSWVSPGVQKVMDEQNTDLYRYVATLMQTPETTKLLAELEPNEAEEFDQAWAAFETAKEEVQMQPLFSVLVFLLQRGVQFLPPSPGSHDLSKNVVSVQPFAVDEDGQVIGQEVEESISYPNLMTPSPLLDPRDVYDIPPTETSPFHNRVVIRNHRSVFHQYPESWEDELVEEDSSSRDEGRKDEMLKALPVTPKYYNSLFQSILMRRTVVQQTGKGKIRRITFMVLVGDGNGLVGYGEGKHSSPYVALKAAQISAVKNMDWVERFEKRTVWTEMTSKLGATQLILRPRPVGFGLRCNPYLHQILRAAGFKDISAKVWGSRNKLNVIKAAFRMLHAGHAPTAMGDGLGGKGRKITKGGGMKGKSEVERARGRKLVSLRV
ncbi:hypothetical protein B0H34DRAFT_798694 [Crassisporium funariophilum]|nr:hypothetical protein B0H34DRAFT_798694 [Crassisporium funariophilum]